MKPLPSAKTFICGRCGKLRGEKHRYVCTTRGCTEEVCPFCVDRHETEHPPEVRAPVVLASEVEHDAKLSLRIRFRRKPRKPRDVQL